jgi:hypothetical protein
LSKVKALEVKNGKSSSEADSIAQNLRQIALATTTDFMAQFSSKASIKFAPAADVGLSRIFSFLGSLVNRAYAQYGYAFGGTLLYTFPCTCNPSAVLLTIGPPSYVLLDYIYGTQLYQSYNAPYARYFLGFYTPGAGESCLVYAGESCVVIPAEGMIQPTVGTSGL